MGVTGLEDSSCCHLGNELVEDTKRKSAPMLLTWFTSLFDSSGPLLPSVMGGM